MAQVELAEVELAEETDLADLPVLLTQAAVVVVAETMGVADRMAEMAGPAL